MRAQKTDRKQEWRKAQEQLELLHQQLMYVTEDIVSLARNNARDCESPRELQRLLVLAARDTTDAATRMYTVIRAVDAEKRLNEPRQE